LTVNVCFAEAKRVKRWIPNMSIDAREPVAPDEIDTVADREQLDRAFRQLSVDQRAVLVLRHIVGLPMEEVAHTLDIPAGTARSRLYRALQSMRAALEADTRTPLDAYRAASGLEPKAGS
jgi:RNA polymerase sigma factor (sigma-70 family)